MNEEWHDLRIDVNNGYKFEDFMHDMSSKIIWGPSQTLAVWSVDTDSAVEWRPRKDEHFEKMIKSRLGERQANIVVEVVDKPGYQQMNTSTRSVGTSGVTSAVDGPYYAEGADDTFTSQDDSHQAEFVVDWSTLTIIPKGDQDGEIHALVDEDVVFEAMGFKAADDRAEEAARSTSSIPDIPPGVQQDMNEADIHVNDNDPSEPMLHWDTNNPAMSVGTIYPIVPEFRLAVKQHAILHEFELGTEKSDKKRFRGFCMAAGCP